VDLIVVQARSGSRRLPGKVLADLEGAPLLARLLRRLHGSTCFAGTLVATTTRVEDDAVAALAEREGAHVFRGAEEDVLGRFCEAAASHDAHLLARVSADSPFLDAATVDLVGVAAGAADLVQNHRGRGWPHGTAVEVFDRDTLERIAGAATDARFREHVTLYAYEHPDEFTTYWVPPPTGCQAPDADLVVDTPEDLERARRIQAEVAADAPLADVVAVAR
jgi:spore coat polysaccharide biosynthesis protein SpsF